MAQEVDLDDPSTWPDDTAELAELADDMPDDRAGIEKPAVEDTEKDASKEEPNKDDPASDNDDTPAASSDKDEKDEDPDGVMAKDGKNVLPFGVLQKEREKSHAQAERIAELEAAVAEPKADKKPEGDDDGKPIVDAASPDDDELQKEIDSLNADIEHNLEEYGDERLVSGTRSQVRSLEREQRRLKEQVINEQKRQLDAQQQEVADIREAMDSSPKLSGWEADEDQTFHNRATALHAYLLKTDPEYAAKSWADRFKELPGRVEKLHGVTKTPEKVVDIDEAKKAAGKKAPTSISDIQGGDAPAGTDIEELEAMSPSSITQKMMDFKSEDDMEAYVRGLS